MIIGTSARAGVFLRFRQTVSPSMPGSMISSRIRSGWICAAAASPSSPLDAQKTCWKPFMFRFILVMSQMEESSSISRIFGFIAFLFLRRINVCRGYQYHVRSVLSSFVFPRHPDSRGGNFPRSPAKTTFFGERIRLFGKRMLLYILRVLKRKG